MSLPMLRALSALVAVLVLGGCAWDGVASRRGAEFVPITEPQIEGGESNRPGGPVTAEGIALTARDEAQLKEPQLFPGSGRFVQPSAPRPAGLAETAAGDITLNFADTEIREVVRTILGETLGLNFTVDPAVTGSVTFRTYRPIPPDALLSTVETLLADKGFGMIEDDGLYRIFPAGGEAEPVVDRIALAPGLRAGFGTEVFPLEHVDAVEMQKIVQPLIGESATITLDEVRNLLVVTGSSPQRQAVAEALAMFDTSWMAGMSFALLPVNSAHPATIIQELEAIYGLDQDGPQAGQMRFLPIERLGVILTIARRPEDLNQVRTWVERLDRGIAETGRRLYVYYAQHTRVEDIVPILQEIFQSSADTTTSGSRGTSSGPLAPGLEPVRIESPGGASLEAPQVATAAAGPIPAVAPAADAGDRITERGIHITADEVNNAVFILATPRDYRLVQAALESIDLVPLQVLIEATIAEVTLNDELSFGIEWFFEKGNSSFTFSSAEAAIPAQIFPGFSYLFNATNARIVLNALASVTDVNVISSPQLLVLDNRSATLQVGDEVPIATQSAVTVSDPAAPIVNEIEFRDTGVILTVTPRVNAGGTVNMDIEQEVSDVVPTTTSGIDSPTIRQRRVTSTVAIQSGQTIALGGLIRDGVTTTESGLPLLSDIPLLGNLFKTTSDSKNRTELLILITPVVIRDDREALALTEQLRRRLRAIEPLGGKADEVKTEP